MGKRPIDVGLIITTVEDRERDWILSWHEIKELVTTGEAAGFDSVWIPDHLIHEPVRGRTLRYLGSVVAHFGACCGNGTYSNRTTCSLYRLAESGDDRKNGRYGRRNQ